MVQGPASGCMCGPCAWVCSCGAPHSDRCIPSRSRLGMASPDSAALSSAFPPHSCQAQNPVLHKGLHVAADLARVDRVKLTVKSWNEVRELDGRVTWAGQEGAA